MTLPSISYSALEIFQDVSYNHIRLKNIHKRNHCSTYIAKSNAEASHSRFPKNVIKSYTLNLRMKSFKRFFDFSTDEEHGITKSAKESLQGKKLIYRIPQIFSLKTMAEEQIENKTKEIIQELI